MNDADHTGTNGRVGRPGGAWFSPKVLLVLAVIFSAAAAGCIVLVAVDVAIGRPVAGDAFVAGLNGCMAAVFWIWRSRQQ